MKEKEERFYNSKRGFSTSKEAVEVVKKNLGINDKILALSRIWEKETGPLSKYVELAGIKEGVLYIEAASSAHFQELLLRKKELLNKINQHFGKEKLVKNLKIQLKA